MFFKIPTHFNFVFIQKSSYYYHHINKQCTHITFDQKENKYTHIVLDYCGQVGTFANEIRTAVNNNIVQVNGTISMTFCKRASGKFNLQFMKKMLRLNGKIKGLTQINNCETDIEKAIYKFLSIICKENYAIEKQFAYKDKDKSSMILFIIRRLS